MYKVVSPGRVQTQIAKPRKFISDRTAQSAWIKYASVANRRLEKSPGRLAKITIYGATKVTSRGAPPDLLRYRLVLNLTIGQ
jgi:hypothetical protein